MVSDAASAAKDDGPPAKVARLGEEAQAPWPCWPSTTSEATSLVPGGTLRIVAFVEDAAAPRSTSPSAAHGDGCIASGIAFLDHMVDQLTAHAQLRVSLRSEFAGRQVQPHSNELATLQVDAEVARLAGSVLGTCLREMYGSQEQRRRQRFCAPLDEAFIDLSLDFRSDAGPAEIKLAPYGIYPKKGRSRIGSFRPALTDVFFTSLAASLGCHLQARKVRGNNAHHIVEATFKSFARCWRKVLDAACGYDVVSVGAPPPCTRFGEKSRATKETGISVKLVLDPDLASPSGTISTGVATLDDLLSQFQEYSKTFLDVQCTGDRWIDEHHSVEDVAITMGKALADACGDKAGFTRMGFAEASCNGAHVLCVMDISNRPCLCSDLQLSACGEEFVGDASVEMLEHMLESLVSSALMTVHLVQQGVDQRPPPATGDLVTAAVRALGLALRECIAIDPRRAGAVSSSKGTLSK